MNKAGCCGFSKSRSEYFRTFPVIEIQKTFYQPPMAETIMRWRDDAPPDFEFTLKAWQLITHEPSSPTYKRLKRRLSSREAGQAGYFRWTDVTRRAWGTTVEAAKILHADKIIFQCPARFEPTDENKDRMREFFTKVQRRNFTFIWEPRGKWQPDEIAQLCDELDLVHCVDPFRSDSVTTGFYYYRLHGAGKNRAKFSEDQLNFLSEKVLKATPVYFMFNNMMMFDDAKRFQELIGQPIMAERT